MVVMQPDGVSECEAAFSDISSTCADNVEEQAWQTPSSNQSRWKGRAFMLERARQKEEERRIMIDAIRAKTEQEEKERELAYLERQQQEDDVETASDSSGLSDVSAKDEAAEGRDSRRSSGEGPRIALGDDPDSDDEQLTGPPKGAGPGSSNSFASSESNDEPEDLPSPLVLYSSDDNTRIELQIQGDQHGFQNGPLRRVVVRMRGDWAPIGSNRFMELVEAGFFHGSRFHRVVKGTLVQFGLPVDPVLYAHWKDNFVPDDTEGKKVGNFRGTLAFAAKGSNTRCCQVFVNLSHNKSFDSQGFMPFAEVVQGMEVIDEIFSGYGDELSPEGTGPDAHRIKELGAEYLKNFPKLSWIAAAEVLSKSGDIPEFKRFSSLKKPGEVHVDPSLRVSFSQENSNTVKSQSARTSLRRNTPPRAASPPSSGGMSPQRRPSSPGNEAAGSGLVAIKVLKKQISC